jgi:hypothetical protein
MKAVACMACLVLPVRGLEPPLLSSARRHLREERDAMGIDGWQRFSLGAMGQILIFAASENSILWVTDLDMATIRP